MSSLNFANFILVFLLLLGLGSMGSFCWAIPVKDVQPIAQREYSETLHDLFSKGQKTIRAILYEIRYYPGIRQSTVNQLVEDLVAAAGRGVSVEVILEDSTEFAKENAAENRQVGERLEQGGVKVYYDSPTQTTHDKLLIIDDRYVVVGSTNWSYHAFEKNNEASVLIDSSEVAGYYVERFFFMRRASPVRSRSAGAEFRYW